jgi:hypothetical protein
MCHARISFSRDGRRFFTGTFHNTMAAGFGGNIMAVTV